MDIDLLMIMTMIVLVTAIIARGVNGVVSKVLDYKRTKAGYGSSQMHDTANAMSANRIQSDRSDMIEDRLRVLERLATDRGALLSDEIEALRDTRREREPS